MGFPHLIYLSEYQCMWQKAAPRVQNHGLACVPHLIEIFGSQWKYTKMGSHSTILFSEKCFNVVTVKAVNLCISMSLL